METPMLHIAGREITPHPPKMKVWRAFLAFFDADKEGLSLEDFLNEHVRLIILGFGREEVTRESVEENVDVTDIVPLTRSLFRWIQSLTFSKLVNLPNGERGVVLSPYQNLLRYYERLQSAYGWTMYEVDSHEIGFLLDQLVVTAICEERLSERFIDDVM